MKKKDVPELYELFKKGGFDLSKTKETKEAEVSEVKAEQVVEHKPLPFAPPTKTSTASAFPKLKSSFTQNAAAVGEKTFRLKYNTVIFLGLLVLIGLIILFVLGVQIGEKKSAQPLKIGPVEVVTQSERPATPVRPSPIPVTSQWGIRLIYYENDSFGRYKAQRIIAGLKEQNITAVFTRREYISGTDQICVYTGPYTSKQAAEKDLAILKSKRRAFGGADIVKLK